MKEAANDDNVGELSLNIAATCDCNCAAASVLLIICYSPGVTRLHCQLLSTRQVVTVLRRGEQNYNHLQQVSSDDGCQVLLKSVDISQNYFFKL